MFNGHCNERGMEIELLMSGKQRHASVALPQDDCRNSLSGWAEGYSEGKASPPDALLETEQGLLRLSLPA